MFALILLLIYSIAFNCSETSSDGTAATTDKAKLIRMSSYDFVAGIDATHTNNTYVAKYGYGMKGGTSSTGGRLTLVLDTTYTVRTLTLHAAAGNKADTASTKGIRVCGQEVKWRAPRLALQDYTITLNRAIDTITVEALTAKNCRYYIEHIELDIEDNYAERGKIQLPCQKHKFPSMEYDSIQPAEDEEFFNMEAEGIDANGISLEMKIGDTYSVTPATLPAEGGEFVIHYTTAAFPSFYEITDSCIVTATGISGNTIRRAMAVSVMIKEYHPLLVDSTGMEIAEVPSADYYLSAAGKRDSALKSELRRIICCGVRYRYGSGARHTWDAFWHTDRDTTDNRVLDMYSTEVRYFNPLKPTASVGEFDIEHMFPKSWWGGTDNAAYRDLYHLVPGDYSANRSKSNHAPGYVTDTTFWNGSFATGYNEEMPGVKLFCPEDEYKGDFARAYFYIATAYGDSLTWTETNAMDNGNWQEFQPWLRDVLLEWHRLDPVSEKEQKRQIEVNKIQGNRNPYIDHPELAEYIWGTMQGVTWKNIPTAIKTTGYSPTPHARKVLQGGGQILIIRDGKKNNILGL